MPQSTGLRVYKYKNIAAALAILLIIMVAINTSCNSHITNKRSEKKTDANSLSSEGDITADDGSDGLHFTKNYKYEELRNGDSLGNGKLCIINSEHPFTGSVTNTDTLYGYMFDPQGTMIMSASMTDISGDVSMLRNFNELCCDFGKKTGLYTLMVNTIMPDPTAGDPKLSEASLGTCLDLMIYDQAIGVFDAFKTEGDYEWIKYNCYKYGFVIRGESMLRYVGRPVSAYICEQSIEGPYDLDKFEEDIKNYTFEEPLLFTDEDSCQYAFYFVPVDGTNTVTKVPVPLREDDSEYSYEISGNNVDGFIVCVDLIGSAGLGGVSEVTAAAENIDNTEITYDTEAPAETDTSELTE